MKEITVNIKDKEYNLKSRLGEVNDLNFKHHFSKDPDLAFLTYIDSLDKQPVMRVFKLENNKLHDYAITPIKMIRYTGDLKKVFDKQKALLKQDNGSWKHFGKASVQNRLKKLDGYYLDQVDEILNINIEEIDNQILSDLTGIQDFNLKYIPDDHLQYRSIFQQKAENAKDKSFNDMDLHYLYLNANLQDFKTPFLKDYMSLGFKVSNHEFINFLNYLNKTLYDYKDKTINEMLNHSFDSKKIADMVIEICDDNSEFMVADETFNSAFFNIQYLNKLFDDQKLVVEILDHYLYDIILHEVDISYALSNVLSIIGADKRLIEVLDNKEQEQAYFHVIKNIMENIICWGFDIVGELMDHAYRLLFDIDTKKTKAIKDRHEFEDLKSYIDYYIPPNLKD